MGLWGEVITWRIFVDQTGYVLNKDRFKITKNKRYMYEETAASEKSE